MPFKNESNTFIQIEKEANAGAGEATLTFKSGSASALTATQDAWLKIIVGGTTYYVPAFTDDVTPA